MSGLHQRTNSSSPAPAMEKKDGAVNGAKPAASGGAFSMEVCFVWLVVVVVAVSVEVADWPILPAACWMLPRVFRVLKIYKEKVTDRTLAIYEVY